MKAAGLKFLRNWFPVAGYSGIIFFTSSLSDVNTPGSQVHFDKLLHLFLYMPFGYFLALGLISVDKIDSRRMFLFLVFIIAFLYGVSDEYHQSFVPGRTAGISDVVADSLGGLLGGWIYIVKSKKLG